VTVTGGGGAGFGVRRALLRLGSPPLSPSSAELPLHLRDPGGITDDADDDTDSPAPQPAVVFGMANKAAASVTSLRAT
jgi:hypothetical protein